MTQPTDALVETLTAKTGLSEEDVRVMLAAQGELTAGVPIKTVQMEPATCNTATRTVRDSIPGWWVVDHSDGSAVWDTNPDKGWPAIYTPEVQ